MGRPLNIKPTPRGTSRRGFFNTAGCTSSGFKPRLSMRRRASSRDSASTTPVKIFLVLLVAL